MLWGLLLNRYTLGGLAIAAVLYGVHWHGDNYGWNARQYAKCKTVTARRNAAIAAVNRSEEAKHAAEAREREAARIAFSQCPGVQSCILTPETAACLNTLRGAP